MAAIVASAFALALFCFLVLSTICVGTFFAFLYRRYYGLQRSPAVDVEAQTRPSSSASFAAKTRESATLSGSPEPRDLAILPSPQSSDSTACSDDKLDRLAKSSMPKSPQNDKSTWKRLSLSWLLKNDRYTRFPLFAASLARAKAKAKDKWIPFNSDTSLATVDITCLPEDVPSTRPKESSSTSLSSKTSASDTRSLSSCVEKPASVATDPSPTPADAVSAAMENASRSSTSKESTSTPRESTSTSASSKLASAFPEPAPASSAPAPTLASIVPTPATDWEPQTPPGCTTVPTDIADGSDCLPSPSTESLEDRSTELNVAALAQSEVILPSGSLPTCVSGLSDLIRCLDVRGSVIEDLAKTAVHPTLGLGFNSSLLSRAAISLSLGSELPASRATSPVPPKVVDGRPRRPALSTSNTVPTNKENIGVGSSSVPSGSKTAYEANAPEQKADADSERYAALVDALSTTFSISSLQARGSTRLSAASASTSSSPSVAHESDLSLGLDVSYELSYDASESDFDGSCCSDDESCKLRPRCAVDPSLHQSCSRSEHAVLAI